jgi:hypothetical protein
MGDNQAMSDHGPDVVRVTNQRIYDLLLDTRDEVRAARQQIKEQIIPDIATNKADIRSLRDLKADRTETTKLAGTIDSVRVQAYAIGSGVLAGLIMLRTLGVI